MGLLSVSHNRGSLKRITARAPGELGLGTGHTIHLTALAERLHRLGQSRRPMGV
jgi:hypothetical protein